MNLQNFQILGCLSALNHVFFWQVMTTKIGTYRSRSRWPERVLNLCLEVPVCSDAMGENAHLLHCLLVHRRLAAATPLSGRVKSEYAMIRNSRVSNESCYYGKHVSLQKAACREAMLGQQFAHGRTAIGPRRWQRMREIPRRQLR